MRKGVVLMFVLDMKFGMQARANYEIGRDNYYNSEHDAAKRFYRTKYEVVDLLGAQLLDEKFKYDSR